MLTRKDFAWGNCLCIRVILDVSLPLCRGRKVRLGEYRLRSVDFRYERLPIFCYLSGKIDRDERDCLQWIRSKNIVRIYVFHMLRTYVMILCNWLIIGQNALYLYLGRLRMCLNTSRNHVSRSSVEAFKSVQEIKQRVQIHYSSTPGR